MWYPEVTLCWTSAGEFRFIQLKVLLSGIGSKHDMSALAELNLEPQCRNVRSGLHHIVKPAVGTSTLSTHLLVTRLRSAWGGGGRG